MERFAAMARRAIVARPGLLVQLGFAFGSVAVATLSRWLLDRGANGVPFATFFPFIVLAAIFLDAPFAILVTLGSVVSAAVLFLKWDDPTLTRASLALAYFVTTGLILAIGQLLRRTVRDLDAKTHEYELINRELQHRARNALQIVGAMASRAAHATTPQEFFNDLSGRIAALIRANDLLGITAHKSGDIARLVQLAMEPFGKAAIRIDGPPCQVPGNVGMRLMMVLHELGTNATKYGALSCDSGIVAIEWSVADGCARMTWEERGGPPVVAPTRRGLGSRLLAAHAPLRQVDVDYAANGLVCTLVFPVDVRNPNGTA